LATKGEEGGVPLVTVGFPTFNREWSLPRVLDSLLAFEYDRRRLRICFVDNGSGDRTMAIIDDFVRTHGKEYEGVVVKSVRSNIPQARNLLFELAKGTDYVFFLDSDITAPPDTVKRLLAGFRDESVGMVALPWDNRNAQKRAGFLFRAFRVPFGPHEAYKVGSGCNMVSMAAYEKVGGYDPKLTVHEDSGYSFVLRKGGFKIISDSSSEGTHLREIEVDPRFYVSFMKDSAVTYRQLIGLGSRLHAVKVISSYLLLASFALLLAIPSFATVGAFLPLLLFCAWMNSSPRALDDGAHARLLYRPLIGLIFTATTFVISLLVLWFALAGPYRRTRPADVAAPVGSG
jgi:glycosyltransferase involved in cell wall biosynthesis